LYLYYIFSHVFFFTFWITCIPVKWIEKQMIIMQNLLFILFLASNSFLKYTLLLNSKFTFEF
jgi:hypothetical protein